MYAPGTEDHAVAFTAKCGAESKFGVAALITVGGIEEVDPGVECSFEHRNIRYRFGAKPEFADFQSGGAKRAVTARLSRRS